jgi:putative methionine-R-sulfoxide reductase with GAF domain
MELDRDKLLREVADLIGAAADRKEKVQKIADAVRLFGNYRWVGIYNVDQHEISVIAWSGIGAPAYPRFGITQGLSGEAVRTRRTIVSNDVGNDPSYLTAFGNTQSEIIVPIAVAGGPVGGTIDVESDRKNAFGDDDRILLESCASLLAQLWK